MLVAIAGQGEEMREMGAVQGQTPQKIITTLGPVSQQTIPHLEATIIPQRIAHKEIFQTEKISQEKGILAVHTYRHIYMHKSKCKLTKFNFF